MYTLNAFSVVDSLLYIQRSGHVRARASSLRQSVYAASRLAAPRMRIGCPTPRARHWASSASRCSPTHPSSAWAFLVRADSSAPAAVRSSPHSSPTAR